MANDASGHDVDFLDAMHDLLDMDKDAVDSLLDTLDSDELQDLTDAVAKRDCESAEKIIAQASNDDAEVNTLFRGQNLQTGEQPQKKVRKPNDGKMQFAIGDEVLVNRKGSDGKVHSVSGTVSNPNGPEGTNTVVVKIEGKPTMVRATDLDKLDENVIGMIGLPNLGRIQQLAGIQSQGIQAQGEMQQIVPEPEPIPDPAPDDPLGQAMAAFDTLEAALPNITLADLKCVRERIMALQQSLNESFAPARMGIGRARK